MKEIIHNSWQTVLSAEFEKPYYQELREFLKKEYQTQTIYPDMYHLFSALELNPFEEEKITQVIEKASKEMGQAVPENTAEKGPKSEAIPIQGEDRIYLVAPEDIYLVSVEERQLSIFVDQQVYKMTGTLNSIEQKLPAALFIKTHRSFILNRTKIQEIQPWFNNTLQVILTNGSKVPVSRSYVKEFKEKLGLS